MKKKRKEEKEDIGRVIFYALLILVKHPKHLKHAVNIRQPTAVLSDNSSSAVSGNGSGEFSFDVADSESFIVITSGYAWFCTMDENDKRKWNSSMRWLWLENKHTTYYVLS